MAADSSRPRPCSPPSAPSSSGTWLLTTEPAFPLRLRRELQAVGLLGAPAPRAACADRAATAGDAGLAGVEAFAGAATVRSALAVRRGPEYARSYRYVVGYGELMTEFLAAPLGLDPDALSSVARLGGIANLIVSYFDEMVDGGWPRSLLLPGWALAVAATGPGGALVGAAATAAPAPARLTTRLVVEYFRRVRTLPHAASRPRALRDVRRTIREMYLEEGRTPREWRRVRGSAERQKKTALPFVVLGLPAWLASGSCPDERYERHRRWLVRLGKFIRWIDDAADEAADRAAGSANLVRRALARRHARHDLGATLPVLIARRGRWLLDEWRAQVADVNGSPSVDGVVLATVLVAWLGEPD